MKKILWFSRHKINKEQVADLERIYGKITINQINKKIRSANELKADINNNDIIAVVAPLALQKEFLDLADEKPVLFCKNKRIFLENGERVVFKHAGWFQVKKIEIEFEKL